VAGIVEVYQGKGVEWIGCGGEAVRILASWSGNQFFKGKMVVSEGQIWIGKLKLLPCFKTLP
jgi:hypothetical protein